MILVVDLCFEKGSLSKYEFVYPIVSALEKAGAEVKVAHYTDLTEEDVLGCERAVLCGTALKDNFYTSEIDRFSWLKSFEGPVLGICAGMQVIACAFGGKIAPKPAIGLQKIDIVKETALLGEPRQIEGYHLHNYGVTLPEGFEIVAGNSERLEAFVHSSRPIYGVIFHPEVRNRWMLERFANLS